MEEGASRVNPEEPCRGVGARGGVEAACIKDFCEFHCFSGAPLLLDRIKLNFIPQTFSLRVLVTFHLMEIIENAKG